MCGSIVLGQMLASRLSGAFTLRSQAPSRYGHRPPWTWPLDVARLETARKFKKNSTLNGNAGSWTNSDDTEEGALAKWLEKTGASSSLFSAGIVEEVTLFNLPKLSVKTPLQEKFSKTIIKKVNDKSNKAANNSKGGGNHGRNDPPQGGYKPAAKSPSDQKEAAKPAVQQPVVNSDVKKVEPPTEKGKGNQKPKKTPEELALEPCIDWVRNGVCTFGNLCQRAHPKATYNATIQAAQHQLNAEKERADRKLIAEQAPKEVVEAAKDVPEELKPEFIQAVVEKLVKQTKCTIVVSQWCGVECGFAYGEIQEAVDGSVGGRDWLVAEPWEMVEGEYKSYGFYMPSHKKETSLSHPIIGYDPEETFEIIYGNGTIGYSTFETGSYMIAAWMDLIKAIHYCVGDRPDLHESVRHKISLYRPTKEQGHELYRKWLRERTREAQTKTSTNLRVNRSLTARESNQADGAYKTWMLQNFMRYSMCGHQWEKRMAVVAHQRPNYQPREDMSVEIKDPNWSLMEGIPVYNGPPKAAKLYCTTLLGFNTSNPAKALQMFDRQEGNLALGLKRLLAKGVDHDLRFNNQIALLFDDRMLPVHPDSLWEGTGFHYEIDRKTATVKVFKTQGEVLLQTVVFTKYRNQGREALEMVRNRYNSICTWDYLEKMILLLYADVKNWCYWAVYSVVVAMCEPFVSRNMNANMVHAKKSLRQEYVLRNELGISASYPSESTVKLKIEEAKLKPDDLKPRLFVSYGAACMEWNESAEFLKIISDGFHSTVMSHGWVHHHIIVAKPKDDAASVWMRAALEKLKVPRTIVTMTFSDDGLIMWCDSHNLLTIAESDISGSDSSIGLVFWYELAMNLRFVEVDWNKPVRALSKIKQAMRPMTVPTAQGCLKINLSSVLLGSGHDWTTVANNYYNQVGCVSMAITIADYDGKVTAQQLEESAVWVGMRLEIKMMVVDGVGRLSKCTFLKCFPMTVEGKIYFVKCLGTIFRRFGSVVGDITNLTIGVTPAQFKGLSPEERANRYLANIVAGLVNEPSNSVIDALRVRFPNGVAQVDTSAQGWDPRMRSAVGLIGNDNDIIDRYELTPDELDEFVQLILTIRLGQCVSCPALDKILAKDYD